MNTADMPATLPQYASMMLHRALQQFSILGSPRRLLNPAWKESTRAITPQEVLGPANAHLLPGAHRRHRSGSGNPFYVCCQLSLSIWICVCWQDEEGRWNKYGGRLPWDTKAICCNNATFGGTGNHKTGEDYVAAPNIDHTQEFVRRDITKWLKLLRSIGFDGFRFDFVKGYSAPCGPAQFA